jgi:hypothetical protein
MQGCTHSPVKDSRALTMLFNAILVARCSPLARVTTPVLLPNPAPLFTRVFETGISEKEGRQKKTCPTFLTLAAPWAVRGCRAEAGGGEATGDGGTSAAGLSSFFGGCR